MIFQIALLSFALFAMTKTWKQYQVRKVSKYWLIMFGVFWAIVATVAIAPQTTDILAKFVGIGRGADLFLYVGVVVLFYLVHRLLLRQQQLSDEITQLVRQLAINQADKPQN